MTVLELIDLLQAVEDKSQDVMGWQQNDFNDNFYSIEEIKQHPYAPYTVFLTLET